MPKLGSCTDRAGVIKALERAGFERSQGAKHLVMYHADGRMTTIPNAKQISIGTLRAIVRQCGLTVEAFIDYYQHRK